MGLSGDSVVKIYIFEAETIVISCIIQGVLIGCFTAIVLTLQFNLFIQMPFMFYVNLPVTLVLLFSSLIVSFLGSYIPAVDMKRSISKFESLY